MSHPKEAQSMELYNGSGNRPTSTLAGNPMRNVVRTPVGLARLGGEALVLRVQSVPRAIGEQTLLQITH